MRDALKFGSCQGERNDNEGAFLRENSEWDLDFIRLSRQSIVITPRGYSNCNSILLGYS